MSEHQHHLRIGPGSDPTELGPDELLADARRRIRDEDNRNRAGVVVARRLLVAFVACVVIGVGFWSLAPRFGVDLPLWLPLIAFVAILAGALLNLPAAPAAPTDDPDAGDGQPVGCCPGPRPVGSLSHRACRGRDQDSA